MRRSFILGVTGGFGTGKSTVARMFEGLGGRLINADKIARGVISPGGAAHRKVVSLFGTSILKKDKRIDRKKLGRIVFGDKRKLSLLNSVVHPEVIKRIKDIVKKGRPAVYIIDAPLLIEAGALGMVDRLAVVTASREAQIKRCIKKSGLKKSDIEKRIRNQMPLRKKRRMADFIIDNDGSLKSTKDAVKKIWREIRDGAE